MPGGAPRNAEFRGRRTRSARAAHEQGNSGVQATCNRKTPLVQRTHRHLHSASVKAPVPPGDRGLGLGSKAEAYASPRAFDRKPSPLALQGPLRKRLPESHQGRGSKTDQIILSNALEVQARNFSSSALNASAWSRLDRCAAPSRTRRARCTTPGDGPTGALPRVCCCRRCGHRRSRSI